MAVKNLRQRIVAFVAGLLLGPTVVWAGLESATYISDLVASNPLSSDLASTADDHIRLLKSTIKTTFPNINNAVTVTDEQLNAVATNVAANPTGTVGLSAVNGSASTYLRSDGAPALSQSITPTWTGTHTFTKLPTTTLDSALLISSSNPSWAINDSNSGSNEKVYDFTVDAGLFAFRTSTDAGASPVNIMTVDRTGTTVDRVAFPTDAGGAAQPSFAVGTVQGALSIPFYFRTSQASGGAMYVANQSSGANTLEVHNQSTAGDGIFVGFYTESSAVGTQRGTIDYDRAGTAVRYNTTSDIRLKKNFKPAPSALSVINCIRVESFDWRETGYHVDHGFVAQRLNECAPYAVKSSADPTVIWGVDPSKLVPALIKYVQEQDARIARLEADAARRH